jgi:hypothetical protein
MPSRALALAGLARQSLRVHRNPEGSHALPRSGSGGLSPPEPNAFIGTQRVPMPSRVLAPAGLARQSLRVHGTPRGFAPPFGPPY